MSTGDRRGRAGCFRERVITTFWVAIGGALGSIARYWLAIVVARLIGPHFPWGTILINVLGSLVIGFFAILTAINGRASASPRMSVSS
jgi:fluoride ion exporter CrcB/FEX